MAGLLDAPARPAAVAWAATAGAVAGFGTLVGSVFVGVVVVSSAGATWLTVAAVVVGVVQVTAGVLLVVGSARLAMGVGRGVLLAGLALEFPVCVAHGLNAAILVAGDPDEQTTVVVVFLGVAAGFAAVSACGLYLALRPTATAYVSAPGGP